MKTIRFKMTPTEIKAGRQKVFSWQTQSLQATYLAVTEWLCHEAEIEQVIIVNEGLKEQNRVIWRLVRPRCDYVCRRLMLITSRRMGWCR